jgi:phosphoglycerol transferase MdoB-like AlkP superfamily enzyme
VLLAAAILAKLAWFHAQLDQPFAPVVVAAVSVGTVLLLVAWLPLVSPTRRLAVGTAGNLALSALALSDLIYFRFFNTFLSMDLVDQAGQTGEVLSSVAALLRPTDAWLFVDVALTLFLWATRGASWVAALAGTFRSGRSKELVAFALTLGAVLVAAPVTVQATKGDAFTLWDLGVYQATGLVGFHVYDAARFAASALDDREVTETELADVEERLLTPAAGADLSGAPRRGIARGSNVLVVQVEALQAFVIGRKVGGREVTPHLNALLGSSIHFTDMRHQTSGGHTADAEWLAGCSWYPAKSGTAFARYADNYLETACLPGILRNHGYSTAAHHANQPAFWNRREIYPRLGYDTFFSVDDYTGDRNGWGVNDADFLTQTVDQLLDRPRPFYDVAITLSSHHPYRLEGEKGRIDAGVVENTVMGDYLDAMNYADAAMGELFTALENSGLWEDTVVVVYGDHDSNINDPSLFDEVLGPELDPTRMSELRSAVPLIVHLPGGAHGGTAVDQPVGQVDIAPLLARLLGLPPDASRTFLGSDPFQARTRPLVFPHGGFLSTEHSADSPSGLCIDRDTGGTVDWPACKDEAALAMEDLRVSELIAEFDLVPRLTSIDP